jgi:hypothetical protein
MTSVDRDEELQDELYSVKSSAPSYPRDANESLLRVDASMVILEAAEDMLLDGAHDDVEPVPLGPQGVRSLVEEVPLTALAALLHNEELDSEVLLGALNNPFLRTDGGMSAVTEPRDRQDNPCDPKRKPLIVHQFGPPATKKRGTSGSGGATKNQTPLGGTTTQKAPGVLLADSPASTAASIVDRQDPADVIDFECLSDQDTKKTFERRRSLQCGQWINMFIWT